MLDSNLMTTVMTMTAMKFQQIRTFLLPLLITTAAIMLHQVLQLFTFFYAAAA